jgi:PEP-CTERM/exosortase A-associated glycosyltransferase
MSATSAACEARLIRSAETGAPVEPGSSGAKHPDVVPADAAGQKRLRVLHVFDHSIPLQSGYTFRSRAILREQQRLGWQTFHVTSPKHYAPGDPEEDVDGLHFYRTPWAPGSFGKLPLLREIAQMRATRARLQEVAQRVRPDLLHAHSPVLDALPALAVGHALGVPVVYEVRAFWEDAAVDLGTNREGGPRYRATRAVETFALRRAAHVTTICEGLKRDIVARGIAESRITVIPNAVDIAAFEFGAVRDGALAARLGLADATVLGFVGSFYAYEGLDVLLRALPGVLQRRPDVRVLLVGGGPAEAKLETLANELGVRDRIVFAGRVAHSEVGRYYGLIDVLVYPRHSMRLTELVTPLKPLEAMAQGIVLLASDVGGHRELIRDGETGVLFRAGTPTALAESLLRLLGARDDWPRMREAARRFVERERNWGASVARYGPVFEALERAR